MTMTVATHREQELTPLERLKSVREHLRFMLADHKRAPIYRDLDYAIAQLEQEAR